MESATAREKKKKEKFPFVDDPNDGDLKLKNKMAELFFNENLIL